MTEETNTAAPVEELPVEPEDAHVPQVDHSQRFKLLVNAPDNTQAVIEVGASGGYYDLERVLWDERVDGELPDVTLGGMTRVADELAFDQAVMDQYIAAIRPPVPQVIPMLNAHLVLLDAGWMPEIDAFIDTLPGIERAKARVYLDKALTMRRDHPLVQAIPAALNKTSAEVDALFVAAAALG